MHPNLRFRHTGAEHGLRMEEHLHIDVAAGEIAIENLCEPLDEALALFQARHVVQVEDGETEHPRPFWELAMNNRQRHGDHCIHV